MTDQQQQALDSFYALDNVVTIKISMPQGDWDFVRNEEPAGGRCNFEFTGGARYTWRKAASVEISEPTFRAYTFTDVGVKKKSFCGSINSEKPCLHLDFGRFGDANVRYRSPDRLTLCDAEQFHSGSVHVRQPLDYTLLGMAGLPHSRCNFARVSVNGTPIGQGWPASTTRVSTSTPSRS